MKNHREFLSCCITVTSFSFTRMKIDNSKRKGVLEISSSLFPIRKQLRLIPPLQPVFVCSTNCSNPCSGSDSRKLPCSAKHSAYAPVLLKSMRLMQMLQADHKLLSRLQTNIPQPAGQGGWRESSGPHHAASVLPRTTSAAARTDSSALGSSYFDPSLA